MRDRHGEGLAKSVMLLYALQTMCVVREMHDKSSRHPGIILAMDMSLKASELRPTVRFVRFFARSTYSFTCTPRNMECKSVWVWKLGTSNASFPYLENL